MKHMILSHYDLDGMVGVINVYNIIKNKDKDFQYQLCGYGTLSKKIKNLEKDKFDILWILDLNLTEEQVELLHDVYTKVNPKIVIWIDHHIYEYDVLNKIASYNDNFCIFSHNTEESASLQVNNFIRSQGFKNDSIQQLSQITNVYDTWMKNDPRWKSAYALNDLFWEYGFESFFSRFKTGYNITKADNDICSSIEDARMSYIKRTIKNYLIHNESCKAVYIYNPECKYVNHYALVMTEVNYYVILKDVNIDKDISYSIRLYNPEFKLTIQELFDIIKQMGVNVKISGGYGKVGSITINYNDNDKFLESINKIFEDYTK